LTAFILLFTFFKERERLSDFRSSKGARAALNFRNTIGIFANKFAFRFRAGGFVAFPVTFGFFANRFAFGFWGLAMSNAMGLFANCDTFGAVEHFATFIWAFDFTFGFFAFNVADGVFGFGARSMAFWWFANWVANSGAMRIIALP